MSKFYNVAHGAKKLETADNFPWPYDIDICFEGINNPVAFSEGVGHGAAGCAVSANEALESKWSKHFELTNAQWFIPYIQKLVEGTPLPKDEIINICIGKNDKEPETYESNYT